jgi:hypothetical protein
VDTYPVHPCQHGTARTITAFQSENGNLKNAEMPVGAEYQLSAIAATDVTVPMISRAEVAGHDQGRRNWHPSAGDAGRRLGTSLPNSQEQPRQEVTYAEFFSLQLSCTRPNVSLVDVTNDLAPPQITR